ncbi:MAG: glucoamylase family protein [Verrucomicrobiales bacterium]
MLIQKLTAIKGDKSVILHWPQKPGQRSIVLRSQDAGEWKRISTNLLEQGIFADLAVTNFQQYSYRVDFPGNKDLAASLTAVATPTPFPNDDAFLDFVQRCSFLYFWYETNPANGLIRDRSRPGAFCSIAANGFGMTALIIGVERGWITRQEAANRILLTLQTFYRGKQGPEASGVMGYKGWFYHFLDMNTGHRFKEVELSSIDTALLLAGMLDARGYFNDSSPQEKKIRQLVGAIYNRIDWTWMLNGADALSMGWHPESGFIPARWNGYNEAMILNILGLGAGKNPLSPKTWEAWTSTYQWKTNYGEAYLEFAPMFGHQYSHCWIDFRGVADDYMQGKGIDYFENSRRATLAQQKYVIENPRKFIGYAADCWGLTACDGPGFGKFQAYSARGGPPPENDDGTIAPTAVGGSLPFAPEICLPTLRNFYGKYREQLWTGYGFIDAFNLTANWWDPEILGIDQGPIVIMIENYRTGSVWKRFMKSPEVVKGMKRAGFKPLTP